MTLSNYDSYNFQSWHFTILTLKLSNPDTFQSGSFWHYSILSNSDTFLFLHFPILTLSSLSWQEPNSPGEQGLS